MRTDDPGRIATEEAAHVPGWLEVTFWSVASLAILVLIWWAV